MRIRGFGTLEAVWREAERRGWHLGTTDNPAEAARWLSHNPVFTDLADRCRIFAKDKKRAKRR